VLVKHALASCAVVGVVWLVFCGGVGLAAVPKLIPEGNFGSGELATPMGVAVDQSSGAVFVSSLTSPSIDEFDASGALVAPPSPFGGGGLGGAGVAVDPANGHLYVVENFEEEEAHETRVDVYAPATGGLLSSFAVAGCANFFGAYTTVQIASDAAGDVYVPCAPESGVRVYSPGGSLLRTIAGSGASALKEPRGVAVDGSGDVWVADTGDNRLEEFSAAGVFVGEIASEGVQSVALDAAGDVFAVVYNKADFCGSLEPPCDHLLEYGPAGVQLADVGAGAFEQAYTPDGVPTTVAVDASSGRVYVADQVKGVVWVFGPPSAPQVARELASEVGVSEAKLGALVSPGGIDTTYRFEYDTREYRVGEGPHGVSVPFPEGDVGAGVVSRAVWAAASGLAPGTTYHYRAVATNGLGTVYGVDQTFTTETAAAASCPNEQFRTGFSASLPDCRAYELVTPADNGSGEPDESEDTFRENLAASDGDRMSWFSFTSFPGSATDGETYLSTRGASGWSTENEIPPQDGYDTLGCPNFGVELPAYSSDLSSGILIDGIDQTPQEHEDDRGGCGADSPELVSGEPRGAADLFVRDSETGAYQLVNVTPAGVTPAPAGFDGGSSDLSRVVFDEHAALTADAPTGVDDLYEWSGGVVRLVTILPDGTPVLGALPDKGVRRYVHQVSVDGSRVFFTADGSLYVRENAEQPPSEECAGPTKACTVQVDASQAGGSGGGGQFMDASADGSRVFFLDQATAGLTADTTAGSGMNLYEYDLASGTLTDLTVAGKAEVEGVAGISEEGSYVYFVALGVLASNENTAGETAQQGQQNVYVRNGGETTFITTLGEDTCVASAECARVSQNGLFLALSSVRSLTGYDNTDANTGRPDNEIFLYSTDGSVLACASCDPSGQAPTSDAKLEEHSFTQRNSGAPVASLPHYLSDSGRLFFETGEALVPSDTNGESDVYEYQDGQVQLISSGSSAYPSMLLDASENGDDVFILTRQQLLPHAPTGEALAIYDARVGGGFPAPAAPPPCSTADSCRDAASPQPAIFGAPASATFSGPGDLAAPAPASAPKPKAKPKPVKCTRGFIKRKVKGRARCVRVSARKATKSAHANKRGH
jgi:DNA-binding beta-propeller fold protein YncE